VVVEAVGSRSTIIGPETGPWPVTGSYQVAGGVDAAGDALGADQGVLHVDDVLSVVIPATGGVVVAGGGIDHVVQLVIGVGLGARCQGRGGQVEERPVIVAIVRNGRGVVRQADVGADTAPEIQPWSVQDAHELFLVLDVFADR